MAAKKKKKTSAKKPAAKKASPAKAGLAKAKATLNKAKKAVNQAVSNAKTAINKARGPQPIPEGFTALTPSLVVKGAHLAMDFYTQAFGAKEITRMAGPDGLILHAEMDIDGARFTLGEEMPEMGAVGPKTLGGSPASVLLYTTNADVVFGRAIRAGATVKMPMSDQFWGDRYGRVTDPFGHDWRIATHKEDLTPEQMAERMAAAFASPPSGQA